MKIEKKNVYRMKNYNNLILMNKRLYLKTKKKLCFTTQKTLCRRILGTSIKHIKHLASENVYTISSSDALALITIRRRRRSINVTTKIVLRLAQTLSAISRAGALCVHLCAVPHVFRRMKMFQDCRPAANAL